MLQRHLRTAGRALRRHPLHTGISVLCLTLGLAGCFLIGRYVAHALSYDDHWPRADRLVRLVSSETTPDGTRELATAPMIWGPALAAQRPEVEAFVRIDPSPQWVSYGDDAVRKGEGENLDDGTHLGGTRVRATVMYADPSVLDVFGLDVLRGDPETALANEYNVLLTERFAREHFGDRNPVGEMFKLGSRIRGFEVVGVVEDVPANSHFTADLIIPHSGWILENWVDWTSLRSVYTYLVLSDAGAREALEAALPGFLRQNGPPDLAERFTAGLQPVTSIHLRSDRVAEIRPGGDRQTVLVLAVVAGMILLLGCVNFANLATARAADRQMEVGVRKALGARRGHLVQQFLTEALVVSAAATAGAASLAAALLPVLNAQVGTSLSLLGGTSPVEAALGALGVVLGVTLLAGGYPALGLSRFDPKEALAGRVPRGRSARLRSGLVVAQFAVAIVLVIGTGAMYQQVDHMTTRHPGFDKEHVVMMPVSGHGQNTNFARSIRAFKASASVLSVATVDRGPGGRPRPRLFRRADTGRTAEVSMLFADSAFARTMGLEMLAGTWIRERIAAEGTPGVVLNATAARRLGFAAPREAVGALVGRIHPDDPDSVGTPSRVVGVVRDFRWSSVRETAPPMVITPADIKYNLEYWVIRVAPGATQPTLRHLEATWKALAFYPEMYDYSFLSDDWSALYRTERHLQQVTSVFAALAVVIACLGLFGLATYTARRRTKEIGIRKALGATVGHIVGLLSAAFLRRVGLAALVALPVAYVAVRVWLQQFADRVALSPWLFAAAVAAALTLAALTVSVQALRAARLDPVDALRDE